MAVPRSFHPAAPSPEIFHRAFREIHRLLSITSQIPVQGALGPAYLYTIKHKDMNIVKHPSQSSKAMTGSILIIAGTFLLADQLGADLPRWILSWPMLLIVIGLVSGVKHRFTRPGAFFMLFIGLVFLVDNYLLNVNFSIVWPSILIGAGTWMIFKRKLLTTFQRDHEQ